MRDLLVAAMLIFCVACSPKSKDDSYFQVNDAIVGGESVLADDSIAASTIQIITVYKEEGQKPVYSSCTGTIISQGVVLTAAHCTEENPFDMYIFFSSEVPLRFSEALKNYANTPFLRQVSGALVPEFWVQRTDEQTKNWGDLALLRFTGGLPQGFAVAPLLPAHHQIQGKDSVVLAGFGLIDGKDETPAEHLRKVQVRVAKPHYSKSEFLVGDFSGKGSCRGDSGGPAFIEIQSVQYLAGVTSRSDADKANEFKCMSPSIYTGISFYRQWIEQGIAALEDANYVAVPIPQPSLDEE